MTYTIKCNGMPVCTAIDRKSALNTLNGLQDRALKQGLGVKLRAVMDETIEYILTVSNGLTYEVRMVA